jgi:hypothetical protein
VKALIFVYNVDSGLVSSIKRVYDSEHFECKLYSVIRGKLFVKRIWRKFLNNLSYKKIHLYRFQFRKTHPEYTYLELPSILLKDDLGITVLVTAREIRELEDTDDCIGLLGQKLAVVTTSSSNID